MVSAHSLMIVWRPWINSSYNFSRFAFFALGFFTFLKAIAAATMRALGLSGRTLVAQAEAAIKRANDAEARGNFNLHSLS